MESLMALIEMIDEVSNSINAISSIISAFLIIIGAVQCFFGYRLFRVIATAIGFFAGGLIGSIICGIITHSAIGALIGFLLIGVLGAWLAFKLYKLTVFAVCFFGGGILGLAIALVTDNTGIAAPLVAILGLLFGIFGVLLTKPVIIAVTGLSGGISVGTAFCGIFPGTGIIGILLGVVLGIVGIYLQFWMDKKGHQNPTQTSVDPIPASSAQKMPLLKTPNRKALTFSSPKIPGVSVSNSAKSFVSNIREQVIHHPTTTKTIHKCAGQKVLAKSNTPLWHEGLPIVITETYIASRENDPENPNRVYLSFGFQNLSNQAVIAVYFSVRCYNLLKQELQQIDKLTVQDINLNPGELWFSETPYSLPDDDTRRIELIVQNIVMGDGTIWNNESENTLTPLPEQSLLNLPEELTAELSYIEGEYTTQYDLRRVYTYQPQDGKTFWNCACGQMNLRDTCLACGMERDSVFELTQVEFLRQKHELRLAEQKRQEEERRQKIAEQTQAVKENAEKIAAQSTETVKKCYAKSIDYGKQWGQKISAYWKQGCEKTHHFYVEKILPNKKKIAKTTVLIVAIALFCVTGWMGIQKYQAYRSEQEHIELEEQRKAEEQARLEAERQQELEQEAAVELLQQEYEQMISERSLYDGYTSGLCYANYIDFDDDGQTELLTLEVSQEDNETIITAEIYGAADGKNIQRIGEVAIGDQWFDVNRLSLVKCGERTLIKQYFEGGHAEYFYYYGVRDGVLVMEDELEAMYGNSDGTGYALDDGTAAKYETMEKAYTAETELADNSFFNKPVIYTRGVLPELPDTVWRKAALLDVLDSFDIIYAKLIDFDQDGSEDLLVLTNESIYNAEYDVLVDTVVFRVYSWNGSGIQSVDLDLGLEYGDVPTGIYQENSTDALYVGYIGGVDMISWDIFENMSDYIKISNSDYMYDVGNDEYLSMEFIDGGWEQYQAELNRFELIEEINQYGDSSTLDAVRQELMAR